MTTSSPSAPAAPPGPAPRSRRRSLRALGRRVPLALVVLTVVLASILALNAQLLARQADTASLVAAVARQRVLVERYGRDVALTIRGIEDVDARGTASQLLQNARVLTEGGAFDALAGTSGRSERLEPPTDPDVLAVLVRARRLSERLVALGRRALALGPEDARLSSLLAELQAETAELADVAGGALDQVEAKSQRDASRLVRTEVALGALGLLASVAVALRFRSVGRAEEDARYRALIEHATDVVLIVDRVGAIRYASPSVERVCGHGADELVGRDVADVLHEDDRRDVRAALRCGPGDARVVEHRVRHRDGRWLHAETRVTNLLEHQGISGYVLNLHDVTERKGLEAELSRRALEDPLTRLPNRVVLQARAEQALARGRRTGERSALLYLDLDRFKEVNDTYGHAAGDALLVAVADVLRDAVRPQDTVARLGGDEFAILLEDVPCAPTPETPHGSASDRCLAAVVAGRILAALESPILLDGWALATGASIGIAHADPDADVQALLRAADAAMYLAKRQRGIAASAEGDLVVLSDEPVARAASEPVV